MCILLLKLLFYFFMKLLKLAPQLLVLKYRIHQSIIDGTWCTHIRVCQFNHICRLLKIISVALDFVWTKCSWHFKINIILKLIDESSIKKKLIVMKVHQFTSSFNTYLIYLQLLIFTHLLKFFHTRRKFLHWARSICVKSWIEIKL